MKLPISLKIVTSSATVMLALNSVSTTEAARRCRLRATSGYSTPVSSNSAVSPSTAHLSPVTPSTPVHAQQQQQQRQYQQKQQPQQQQPQQKAVVKNTFVAPAPAPVQSGLTADQAGVLAAHNA